MKHSITWKEETFYDERIEIITEGISTYYEMLMFGDGYKRYPIGKDQGSVIWCKESNKVLQHSTVILILYHKITVNLDYFYSDIFLFTL